MKWGETRYGFITQDNKLRTCQAVIRGAAPLLQNIVDKANVKLGYVPPTQTIKMQQQTLEG